MSHIHGYPSRTTVPRGGTLELHYLTDEPSFRVKVYRQGATLALLYTSGWTSAVGTPGQAPVPWNATGDVSADWGWPSIDIPLDPSWQPGVYIVALEAMDAAGNVVVTSDDQPYGDSGKAVFVVRGSAGSASILYKLSLTTYHAYNLTGESSLYDGQLLGAAPDGQGGSHVGYKITLLRPGGGTGGSSSAAYDAHDTTLGAPSFLNMFGHWDVHFIRWLEGQGFAVDYCTDLDLHLDAALLAPYRLLMSAGHDEYWSQEMRANVDAFVRSGGNVAFFSGNTCYWRIYFADENGDGVPDAIVCDKRLPDGTYGGGNGADNWWRQSPENATTGVSTRLGGWIYPMLPTGFGYTVQRSSSWVYAGSGVTDGDAFGVTERLIAYEFDGLDYEADPDRPGAMRPTTHDGTPASFVILGLSELPASAPVTIPEREPQLSALPSRATMGYFTNAGTVFTGGTTEWARVLAMTDTAVQAITRNIVKGLSSARGIVGLADFDGGGKDDILYTVPLDSGTGIGLWTMSGPDVVGGGYVSDWQEPRWTLVDAADFDGDGKPDLVFHDRATGQLSVWFLGGADRRTVQRRQLVSASQATRWTLVAARDFDGDGKPDLVFHDRATGEISVWILGGTDGTTFVRSQSVDRVQDPRWTLVTARDFNGDGKPDLVFHDRATGEISIWILGGADGTTFLSSQTVDRGQEPPWTLVGAGDLDGDGRVDLLFQHGASGQLTAWFMGDPPGVHVVREAAVPSGQTPAASCGPAFRGWQSQPAGGTYAGDTPTLARVSDGRIGSFGRGTDGLIYFNLHSFASVWQGWTVLTGLTVQPTDRVAVGTYTDGRLIAFVRGADGVVYFRRQSGAGPRAWSEWTPLPGLTLDAGDAVSVARAGDGRLVVAARQSSAPGTWAPNHLNWEVTPMSGQWRGWQGQPAGGTYAKDTTTLAPLADGRIASFARGTDGNIYLNVHAFDSVWQGWWILAGISLAAGDQVAVGRYADGRLAAFARDTAGNIRCSTQAALADPHAWSAWTTVPGLHIASGDPLAVVTTASGRLVLFARGSTGGLSCNQESSEGAWCGWASVPGLQAEHGDAFAAARAGDDRLVVANRQGASSGAWSPHALNWQT